jgi:hypothetical protein
VLASALFSIYASKSSIILLFYVEMGWKELTRESLSESFAWMMLKRVDLEKKEERYY